MSAINFALNITETGDSGSGPYTVVLLENPTTAASGGTTLKTFSASGPNATGSNASNVRELVTQALNWLSNTISKAQQTDSNN